MDNRSNKFPADSSSTSQIKNILKKINQNDLISNKELETTMFSIVYKGTWKNTTVAIKQFKPSEYRTIQDQVINEKEITNYLQQPFIKNYPLVKTIGFTDDAHVMEFMPNGDLYNFIIKNNLEDYNLLSCIATDIYIGIGFLHFYDVIHRDIKIDNILFDENMHAKICDFGFSIIRNHGELKYTTLDGTVEYLAPELITANNNRSYIPYSFASDMYAAGIVTYGIFTGKTPYPDCNTTAEVLNAALDKTKRPVIPQKIPKDISLFIRASLNADPKERPIAIQGVEFFEERKNKCITIS